jgi:hypothetical protein
MDLILVSPTFYLSLYLNFNRSGAAGNLIWFFSSLPPTDYTHLATSNIAQEKFVPPTRN